MKKRKDECLFCTSRKCGERVVSVDDEEEHYDEIACTKHMKDLHKHSDVKAPGIVKIFSSSTGRQVRNDTQIFKTGLEQVKED